MLTKTGEDRKANIKCLLEHANSYRQVVIKKRNDDLERNGKNPQQNRSDQENQQMQQSHDFARDIWTQFDQGFQGIAVKPDIVQAFAYGAQRNRSPIRGCA